MSPSTGGGGGGGGGGGYCVLKHDSILKFDPSDIRTAKLGKCNTINLKVEPEILETRKWS